MKLSAVRRTRSALITFVLILLLFLIIFDALIISQQNRVMHNLVQEHTRHEFELLGQLISASLIQGDYANVEVALQEWGHSQPNVLEARLLARNGFVLASYRRDRPAVRTGRYQEELYYGDDRKVILYAVKDLDPVYADLQQLIGVLILFSIILVTLLGLFLHRLAIRPLQTEIDLHLGTEKRLRKHTHELQRLNRELEAFSYSLSHDLRTPLRSVTSYSQILKDEAAHKLTEEEQGHLRKVINAGKYMAELIDEILELARVSQSEFVTEYVNLSELAAELIQSYQAQFGDSQPEFNIEPDMVVNGNRALLKLLLDNLLSNAIKFSSKTATPRIEFGSRIENNEVVYYVKDNGVGFDMRYHDKLFAAFQRLYTAHEFPGTGIGLATAQRIVQRHNGRIWAESKPAEGATFYFVLGS